MSQHPHTGTPTHTCEKGPLYGFPVEKKSRSRSRTQALHPLTLSATPPSNSSLGFLAGGGDVSSFLSSKLLMLHLSHDSIETVTTCKGISLTFSSWPLGTYNNSLMK